MTEKKSAGEPAADDPGRTLALLWGAAGPAGPLGADRAGDRRGGHRAGRRGRDRRGVDARDRRQARRRHDVAVHPRPRQAGADRADDRHGVAGAGLRRSSTSRRTSRADWREALRFIARRNWERYLRHPWLLQVADGRPVLGPNINRKYEAELRPLDGIGLTDLEMDSVLTAGADARRGTGPLAGRRCRPRATRAAQSDVEWWTNLEPALAAVMDPARFPARLAGRPGRGGVPPERRRSRRTSWTSGIERILDGVARADRAARSRPGQRGTLIAMTTIAILGAGKIGEAMLAGLLAAGRLAGLADVHRALPGAGRRADRSATACSGVETDEAAAARPTC